MNFTQNNRKLEASSQLLTKHCNNTSNSNTSNISNTHSNSNNNGNNKLNISIKVGTQTSDWHAKTHLKLISPVSFSFSFGFGLKLKTHWNLSLKHRRCLDIQHINRPRCVTFAPGAPLYKEALVPPLRRCFFASLRVACYEQQYQKLFAQ